MYKHEETAYPDNWNEIRAEIIKRDRYTCFRCEEVARRMSDLSVHHLIPRAEGGGENEENLITLCHACHNEVEVLGLRTRVEIIGSYEGDPINYTQAKSGDKNSKARTETFARPPWHANVYGGMKKR